MACCSLKAQSNGTRWSPKSACTSRFRILESLKEGPDIHSLLNICFRIAYQMSALHLDEVDFRESQRDQLWEFSSRIADRRNSKFCIADKVLHALPILDLSLEATKIHCLPKAKDKVDHAVDR